jgi:hypothetical protein
MLRKEELEEIINRLENLISSSNSKISDELSQLVQQLETIVNSYDSLNETSRQVLSNNKLFKDEIIKIADKVDDIVYNYDDLEKLSKKLIENNKLFKDEIIKIADKVDDVVYNYDDLEKLSEKLVDSTDEYKKLLSSIESCSEDINVINKKINDTQEEKIKLLTKESELQGKSLETAKEQSKEGKKNKKTKTDENEEIEKTNLLYNITLGALKTIGKVGKDSYNTWMKYNQQAFTFGRQMGMSFKDTQGYQTALMQQTRRLAFNYGLAQDALIKFQMQYAQTTKRNIQLTQDEHEVASAMIKLMGEEGTNALINTMDEMGGSINTAFEQGAMTFERAKAMGLNAAESTGLLAKNMKMASRYAFKEGVDGLSKMTLLSQRLKFNLESAGGVLEKGSSFEGAIEMASKMQMLGGSYAANFSNPLQVLYESLNDAEGMVQRIVDTVASKGNFNKETGMVDVSPVNKAFMREMAQNLGMSYDELYNMASRSAYNKKATQSISSKQGLSKEEQETLATMSSYSRESGFTVTYLDSNSEQKTAKLSEINKGIFDEIQKNKLPETLDENVAGIHGLLKKEFLRNAKNSVSAQERIQGVTTMYQTTGAEVINPVMSTLHSRTTEGGYINKAVNWASGDGLLPKIATLSMPVIGSVAGTILATKALPKMNNLLKRVTGNPVGGGVDPINFKTSKGREVLSGTPHPKNPNQMLFKYKDGTYGWSTSADGKAYKEFISPTPSNVTNPGQSGKIAKAGKFGKFGKFAKGFGGGTIATLAGVGVDMGREALVSNGTIEAGSGTDYLMKGGSRALEYAGTGAMIGSFIPGIGTGIGAAVGALAGAGQTLYEWTKAQDAKYAITGTTSDYSSQVNTQGNQTYQQNSGLSDINLHMSGTIKLVSADGTNIDISKIFNEPKNRKALVEIISKEFHKAKSGGAAINQNTVSAQLTTA